MRRRGGRLVVPAFGLLLTAWALEAAAEAALPAGQELRPRRLMPKPAALVRPAQPSILTVKFRDHLRVRAVVGELVSQDRADLAAARAISARYGLSYEPLIRVPREKLEKLEHRAAARSGVAQPDLAGMLVVRGEVGHLEAAARDLLRLDEVEWVEFSPHDPPPPPCADIPPVTPHFFSQGLQGYHGPDPGVDATYAWSLGARGDGIRIADCEYGHIQGTEDLCAILDEPGQTVHPTVVSNGWDNHGSAVLGEIVGLDNDYGITGLAPDASALFFTEWSVEEGFRRLTAITDAIASVDPGDIVLLEMQVSTGLGLGPAELDLPVWTVTRTGTDAGVLVIGAAGNGSQNLDAPEYAPYRSRGDSGAILVGAGTPDTLHDRLGFSTYGARVNLQAWGGAVFTAGYGTYAELGGDPRQRYRQDFSGTSSATALVAAAAALVQSHAEQTLGCRLGPLAMRQLLVDTGLAQGSGGHIGPLPDLRAALDLLTSRADCEYAPVCGNGVREGLEACDGAETGACLVSCLADCTCAAPTPGEAFDLRVDSFTPSTGTMAISWTPACAAAGHSVVYGPLDSISSYAYSGQVCGVGGTGHFEDLVLGPGSYYFFVVANDGATHEGSYGRDRAGLERPEALDDPFCGFAQTLYDRCD